MARHPYLRHIYNLSDTSEIRDYYDETAGNYDQVLHDEVGYVAPDRTADALAAHTPVRDQAIIDIGCGTGLVGEGLVRHGFTVVDGADYSRGMLAVARDKGCYRELFQVDLNHDLSLPARHYDVAISAGAIGIEHIEASALDRIVALLVPGGLLVVTLNERAMQVGQGIAEKFQALQVAGTLIPQRTEIVDYHLNEGIKGWLGIFQAAPD